MYNDIWGPIHKWCTVSVSRGVQTTPYPDRPTRTPLWIAPPKCRNPDGPRLLAAPRWKPPLGVTATRTHSSLRYKRPEQRASRPSHDATLQRRRVGGAGGPDRIADDGDRHTRNPHDRHRHGHRPRYST